MGGFANGPAFFLCVELFMEGSRGEDLIEESGSKCRMYMKVCRIPHGDVESHRSM
jgi:hypothetical protein